MSSVSSSRSNTNTAVTVTLTQKNKMEGMGKQLMKQVSNSWMDDKINQWPAINSNGHVQMFCSGTSVET